MEKQLMFSLTKSDFRWDYYKGSGNGGQKRNKTENCCRCVHVPSGAIGKSEEGRSKEQNRKKAFKRMSETKEFKDWLRLEIARVSGELAEIEKRIDKTIKNKDETKIEIHVDGKWQAED